MAVLLHRYCPCPPKSWLKWPERLRKNGYWLQRYRTSGRAAPLPRGHNPPALNDTQMQQLSTLVQQTPDATLEQLRHAMDLSCSIVAVHNALKRLG